MRREFRCKRCNSLLFVLRDGEIKQIEVLCTKRGRNTGNCKCDTLNQFPVKDMSAKYN